MNFTIHRTHAGDDPGRQGIAKEVGARLLRWWGGLWCVRSGWLTSGECAEHKADGNSNKKSKSNALHHG